jgi:FkbM family methyltransferase
MNRLLELIVFATKNVPFLFNRIGYVAFSKLAENKFAPGIVERKGRKWQLTNLKSMVERALYLDKEYDKPTEEFIHHFVKPGDVCIDVGANIGYFTALMSEKVGPSGMVKAFEASPIHFESLKMNMELNNSSNCELNNFALGEKEGVVPIYTMNSTGSIVSDYKEHGIELKSKDFVPMKRLDDLMTSHKVSFIKIDVDGNELQVLRGAERMLKNTKPMICVEICERTQLAGGSTSGELLFYLQTLGYQFYLDWNADRNSSIDDVIRISEEKTYIDILCK